MINVVVARCGWGEKRRRSRRKGSLDSYPSPLSDYIKISKRRGRMTSFNSYPSSSSILIVICSFDGDGTNLVLATSIQPTRESKDEIVLV